jgi:hypothetical protein
MGSEDVTQSGPGPSSSPAAAAGQAALGALVTAAVNAAKPGSHSSELKVTIVGIVATAVVAGLHVFAAVPGPWMIPAAIASAGIAVGSYAYAQSRGNVKAAALAAATSVAYAAAKQVAPAPAPDEGADAARLDAG